MQKHMDLNSFIEWLYIREDLSFLNDINIAAVFNIVIKDCFKKAIEVTKGFFSYIETDFIKEQLVFNLAAHYCICFDFNIGSKENFINPLKQRHNVTNNYLFATSVGADSSSVSFNAPDIMNTLDYNEMDLNRTIYGKNVMGLLNQLNGARAVLL